MLLRARCVLVDRVLRESTTPRSDRASSGTRKEKCSPVSDGFDLETSSANVKNEPRTRYWDTIYLHQLAPETLAPSIANFGEGETESPSISARHRHRHARYDFLFRTPWTEKGGEVICFRSNPSTSSYSRRGEPRIEARRFFQPISGS